MHASQNSPGIGPAAQPAHLPAPNAAGAPTLLVLAAGMGSRYGGLKQIDPLGPSGETIIDYSIYDAIRAGFRSVVFVIRRDMEAAFRDAVGRRFEGRLPVRYVFQELSRLPAGFAVPAGRSKPWGTGQAILAADDIREPFAVINADDFYGAQSYELLASHLLSDSPDYAMAGFTLKNTLSEHGKVARGICQVDAAGLLKEVVEMTGILPDGAGARQVQPDGSVISLAGDATVSMNMWGFAPTLFGLLAGEFSEFLRHHAASDAAEFYIPSAVNSLVGRGRVRVRVLATPAAWFGVTYQQDRPRVVASIRSLIQRGEYPQNLWDNP